MKRMQRASEDSFASGQSVVLKNNNESSKHGTSSKKTLLKHHSPSKSTLKNSDKSFINGDRSERKSHATSSSIHSSTSTAIEDLEESIKVMHLEIQEKKDVIESLVDEVKKMQCVFHRLLYPKGPINRIGSENNLPDRHRGVGSKGPFTLVFHGVEPDWIETEMDDDENFKRDVLEVRMRALIKESVGIEGDLNLITCFRYEEGPKIRGHPPVIVTFKFRKDKELVLRRSKESLNLREESIFVTEDSKIRLMLDNTKS